MRIMALLLKSATPVWAVCILCVVAIGVWVAPSDYLQFLPVVLGFVMLLTLCVQLGTAQASGYILRTSVTAAGSIVVLGIGTAILAPVALAAG